MTKVALSRAGGQLGQLLRHALPGRTVDLRSAGDLESVCVRIGGAIQRPTEFRHLRMWFGLDDLLRFTECCIDTPDLSFLVAWGVSNNTRSYRMPPACERLGYRPVQNPEEFAPEILRQANPSNPVGQRYQSGSFASIGLTPREHRRSRS